MSTLNSPEEYLEIALQAERWIHKFEHETEHGVIWSVAAEAPTKRFHNLYSGAAGVAIFYLELYQMTGERSYLETASRAGQEIVHQLGHIDTLPCAPAGGFGGYLFALTEIGKATGNDEFLKAAASCATRQREQAEPIGAGIGWVQEMPYAKLTGFSGQREIYDVAEGAAGASLAWIYAHEQGIHPEALAWATAAADRLLEVAEDAEGGQRWQLMDDIPWPFDAPNFAHGTAGVAFFFARLYEHTKDQKYLDAAIAGAGHVQAMSVAQSNGHLVPHILNDGRDDRYYLGYCHGPAGTARLFYLLNKISGDTSWAKWARGLDDGLVALGAPEQRSRGFWNNISQCCCDAGIGDHAISNFRATNDDFYMDLAQRVAKVLVESGTHEANTICWPQAEHRGQPDFIQTQTGYMQGAAGVGSFFVHLASTQLGKPVKIDFPESPYRRLGAA